MDPFLDQESAQDAITKRGRLLPKQRKKELRGERRHLLLKVPCVSLANRWLVCISRL